MSLEKKEQRIQELERTLRSIALLGGNLPDERLTDKTGPNDSVARGLMYVEARREALAVLHTTLDEMWK
jgi:hypothetical protein